MWLKAAHQFKALTPSDRRSYGLAQRSVTMCFKTKSNNSDSLGYPYFSKPHVELISCFWMFLEVATCKQRVKNLWFTVFVAVLVFSTCKTMQGFWHVPYSHVWDISFQETIFTLIESWLLQGPTPWIDCQLQG